MPILLRLHQVPNGDPFFEGQSSRHGTRAGRSVFQFAFARQFGPTPKPRLPKPEDTQSGLASDDWFGGVYRAQNSRLGVCAHAVRVRRTASVTSG